MKTDARTNYAPSLTIASTGRWTVRVYGRLRCDECGCVLEAKDVEVHDGIQITCPGCHKDLATIGPAL